MLQNHHTLALDYPAVFLYEKGKKSPHYILRPLYFSPKTWDRNWKDFLKCAYIDFSPQKSCQPLFPAGFKILESKTLSHYLSNGWLRVFCHFSSQSQWKESTFTHLPYSCTVHSFQSCPTFCHPTDCNLSGTSVHGDSPGKNTGVGSLSLLQGILPTQKQNWRLPCCRQTFYQLSYQGSPVLLPEMTCCPDTMQHCTKTKGKIENCSQNVRHNNHCASCSLKSLIEFVWFLRVVYCLS